MPKGPYKTALGAARAVHHHMDRLFVDPYTGIAASPGKRLFSDHRVDRENGHWIAVPCASEAIAREAEAMLLATGDYSGGSRRTRWLYAYDKTFYTREDR